jgi:hypothetical protein
MRQQMTTIRIALTLSLAITAAACSGTWGEGRTRDAVIAGYVASSALVACDISGTLWMSHGGRYDRVVGGGHLVEGNQLLGHEPSISLLAGVGVGLIAGGLRLVSSDLPSWVKLSWFGAVTAVESYAVINNLEWVGACGAGARDAGLAARP